MHLFRVLLLLLPMVLSAKVEVIVSIVPEKYFVEAIAADLVNVTVMVPPGASPATYEPRPSQMRALAKADIYLAVGVPFERAWLSRFAAQNPGMRVVDITEGIRKVPMAGHHRHVQHERSHALDPHVWLSPPLVKTLALNIAHALQTVDPAHKAAYERGLRKFLGRLDALDERLRKILASCRGEAMMVFHPSWGYFARSYGLHQIPIEIEGKEPRPRELAHLIHTARESKVRAIFIQPQFARRAALVLADQIGAKVIEADPMALSWEENLLQLAQTICKAKQ